MIRLEPRLYISMQQSKLSPEVLWLARWHCCPRLKVEGNSTLGHLQPRGYDTFDWCTERYEIVVLFPNSELTKCNNKRDAVARMIRLRRKTMAGGLFKLEITSLFVVRNIKCVY